MSGIDGKSGQFDALYAFFDFRSLDKAMFSSIGLVPSDRSEIDHFFLTSARSVIEHLHHIHANCERALTRSASGAFSMPGMDSWPLTLRFHWACSAAKGLTFGLTKFPLVDVLKWLL